MKLLFAWPVSYLFAVNVHPCWEKAFDIGVQRFHSSKPFAVHCGRSLEINFSMVAHLRIAPQRKYDRSEHSKVFVNPFTGNCMLQFVFGCKYICDSLTFYPLC